MNSIKTFIEIEVEVFFDYSPFSPQTQTDPECPAEIENISVGIIGQQGTVDIVDVLDKSTVQDLESQCMESMNSE